MRVLLKRRRSRVDSRQYSALSPSQATPTTRRRRIQKRRRSRHGSPKSAIRQEGKRSDDAGEVGMIDGGIAGQAGEAANQPDRGEQNRTGALFMTDDVECTAEKGTQEDLQGVSR